MAMLSPVVIGENDQENNVEGADDLWEPEYGKKERVRVVEEFLPIVKVS